MRSAWGSRGAAAIAARIALGALAVALALPAPAWSASHRRHHQTQVNTSVTGPLTIAWQGDPAHGCAAAGLCGVSGTLQMHFGNSEVSGNGPPELSANDDSAVVRVQTTRQDGSVTTCADLVAVQFDFAVHRTGGRWVAGISNSFGAGLPPSSGRCAGPTSADLAALTVPAQTVGHGYDLSGRTSFIKGPFAVSVSSGVRAHITYGTQGGGPFPGGVGTVGGTVSGPTAPVKPHSVLVESARVTYRVTGVSGTLTTNFTGVAPPQCEPLGACGLSGRLTQAFADRGPLSFAGARLVHRRIGRGGALADLRSGVMTLSDTFGEQDVHETVAEASTQTGGLPCAATGTYALIGALASRPRRGLDELALAVPNPDFGFEPPDLFRTPCPGPGAQDVLGPAGGAMATATVTAGQLGAPHLAITFRRHAAFHSAAYAGRREGAIVVSLALVRRTGGTRRQQLFPGEPVFP